MIPQFIRLVVILCAWVSLVSATNTSVQHVHVYPTDTMGEFVFGWATKSPTANSVCIVDSESPVFAGQSRSWSDGVYSAVTHWVVVQGLKPGSSYSYTCGDPKGGMSDKFLLKTPPTAGTTYAVYGDFGLVNDRSLADLKASAAAGVFDMILHVGDAAYDLHSDGGMRGDLWEASMEPLTSSIPYTMLPGNHEEANNFSHYRNRFAAGDFISADKTGTNLYWSFDHGLIHFVGFSSEMFEYYPDAAEQQRMYDFLKADLTEANKNRASVPWIVAMAHKGSWMDKTNFNVIGPMLEELGVDLFLVGHVHNYERMFPFDPRSPSTTVQRFSDPAVYTSPKHLVTVVVGSPGCQENIAHGSGPTGANASAVVIDEYGYGLFQVTRTSLQWKWALTSTTDAHLETIRSTRSKSHLIKDSFTIENPRRAL